MAIEKIIVLEDEAIIRKHLTELLQRRNFLVAQADSIAKARQLIDKDDFDLVFADVRLPDGAGTEILDYCQQKPNAPLVALMTAYASVESAVECMKGGAFDYLIKPFSDEQVDIVIKKATEFNQLLKVNQHLSSGGTSDEEHVILGNSPAIEQLNDLIRKVARTQATVLIQGESGTGKELVSRAIYKSSTRSKQPFITVIVPPYQKTWLRVSSLVMKREPSRERSHDGRVGLNWLMAAPFCWMRSVRSLP